MCLASEEMRVLFRDVQFILVRNWIIETKTW
jgi:hypothetical protein